MHHVIFKIDQKVDYRLVTKVASPLERRIDLSCLAVRLGQKVIFFGSLLPGVYLDTMAIFKTEDQDYPVILTEEKQCLEMKTSTAAYVPRASSPSYAVELFCQELQL